MKFIELPLKGAYIIQAEPIIDSRGFFERTFCKKELLKIGHTENFVQVNHTLTKSQGTIRGMHYQIPPVAETKIIRCFRGKILDVIVDIRKNSKTFLKWHSEELSEDNFKMIYVPKGFAHGFQTLTDDCELLYFHSEYYSPDYERGLLFNDNMLNINWPFEYSNISDRDKNHPLINEKFEGVII